MNKTTYAAATLLTLTALAGVGLVHQGATDARQDGDVTPRTVVAEPAPPCPFPYPLAICAPEPPAPLKAPTGTVTDGGIAAAAEYTKAWKEAGL